MFKREKKNWRWNLLICIKSKKIRIIVTFYIIDCLMLKCLIWKLMMNILTNFLKKIYACQIEFIIIQ
jgi:hypothetical protein